MKFSVHVVTYVVLHRRTLLLFIYIDAISSSFASRHSLLFIVRSKQFSSLRRMVSS
jgi:hypothetical protein